MQINPTTNAAGPRQVLHVLDVDGTLTHHDSLLLLLQYFRPNVVQRVKLWLSSLPVAIIALPTGRPQKLKEVLLSQLWKGWPKEKITNACQLFFEKKLQPDLRQKALNYMRQLRQNEPDVKLVLLSASCDAWLQPLADYLQADLICTQLDFNKQQVFTGHFATPNCKGQEKVHRLLQQYPASTYDYICYANSRSDLPLQTISKQFFYRYF